MMKHCNPLPAPERRIVVGLRAVLRAARHTRGRPLLHAAALAGLMFGASSAVAQAGNAPADARTATARYAAVAVKPSREAAAVVIARNESRIAAEVAGTVLRWGPDSSARVGRGEMLVEIDATDHRLARDRANAAVEAALARAALAKAQLQRARELVAQGFFSREAMLARETEAALADADLAAQRLALASAERALGKTRVVAPFDASVAQRLVQTGETVAAGAPLYVLVQTSGAELSARLAPEDADSLRQAGALRFVRPDGSALPLKLLRVAGTLSSPARTVEVRLAGQDLVPGRDGRLVWSDPRPHVPAVLLVRRQGQLGVFSVVDGKARFVALAAGQEGRATPADLPPDTLLVTEGHQALRDGDPVTPR